MSTTDELARITGSGAAAQPIARKTASTLGVQDFLRLMTTQLKNQDPLKPLDSTEFVAQLAQFGTVAGIQGMQSTIDSLSTSLRSSQLLSGANMVGHHILTASNTANYGGGVLAGVVDVPAGADRVTLNISDASGQIVAHLVVPAAEGTQTYRWEGKGDNGAQLPSGRYNVQAIATSGATNQSLATYLYGLVGSVTLSADGTGLTVNSPELGAVSLNSVREII
jgi:flagellar basal-body rod modification protein FlgD